MRETLARAGFLDGDIEFLANERADSFNMVRVIVAFDNSNANFLPAECIKSRGK